MQGIDHEQPGLRSFAVVHAFGICKEDVGDETDKLREQVLVLFRDGGEFAVDLSHNTKPCQVILAHMARKSSLKETLGELDRRVAAAEPKHLNSSAILLAPSMHWKLAHRFSELQGDYLNDPKGREVDLAYQSVHFRMEHSHRIATK